MGVPILECQAKPFVDIHVRHINQHCPYSKTKSNRRTTRESLRRIRNFREACRKPKPKPRKKRKAYLRILDVASIEFDSQGVVVGCDSLHSTHGGTG